MPVRRLRLRPPRLWVLLLGMVLMALVTPLAGLMLLRVYESALVRQTETELVAQAAVLSAAYAVQRGPLDPLPVGDAEADEPLAQSVPGPLDIARREPLDLARDPVLPPAPPEDMQPGRLPAPAAARVGAALEPVLRAAQAVTLAALRITDARGTVVATTGRDLGAGLAGLEEVQRALRGEFVTVLRAREGKARAVPDGFSRGAMLRVHVAMPVISEGRVLAVVVLSRTPSDIVQAIWGKRRALAALTAGVLAAGVLLALAASRWIARPIAAVAAQARRVAAGGALGLGPVQPLRRPGTQEVAALSQAIAAMAATLDRRAAYVRDLAAHVAHEFKTPIAAAAAAAELAGEADVSAPDRARLLAVVADSLHRLGRLTGGLLGLARADMLAALPADVDLGVAMAAAAARAAAGPGTLVENVPGGVPGGVHGCGVGGLRVTVAPSAARVAAPREVVDGILAGLLDNVRAHAGAGACVHLSAEAEAGAGGVLLRVADDGPGVPEADRDRVFDPFFTTARDAGGTGMGLPIVRGRAAGAGGSVRRAASGRGAVFEVVLPAAQGGPVRV